VLFNVSNQKNHQPETFQQDKQTEQIKTKGLSSLLLWPDFTFLHCTQKNARKRKKKQKTMCSGRDLVP
jgi:hypothetical protein